MSLTTAFRCHYAGPPDGPRYEQWREEFGRRWIGADLQPLREDYVANEFSITQHSFLALCRMRSTPARIDRNDAVNNAAGYRYLIIASSSRLQTQQRGRLIDLSLGQMALMSADEPARVSQVTEGDRWSIRISRKLLDDRCRNVDDKLVRPIDASSELTKLLSHQIETAHRFGPKLDASANNAFAQHLLDLMGLCLGADGDAAYLATHRGLAAARLQAIKAEILQDLGKPDLALSQVAARHGLSTRYIQHLFDRSGTSFTTFVLEQRLQLAHRLLRQPTCRWRKVSDIAAAAGFSDISYFNRAFKARFEATPTEIRASSPIDAR